MVGDLASATDEHGRPLPGLAQVAIQGEAYAARSILRKVRGQPPLPPFRYFDKGTLAVIGRAAAVANVFGTLAENGSGKIQKRLLRERFWAGSAAQVS